MKFDEILEHLGEFGRYQKWIFYLLCIPSLFLALKALSVVFLLDIPPHRCSLGENDTYAIQDEQHAYLVNMSIPRETEKGVSVLSSCLMYETAQSGSHSNNRTRKCNSWVFDKSIYESTLIEEFKMVCDDRILRSHSNMASFAGTMCGTISMGLLADIFGRRRVYLCNIMTNVVVFIAIAFSPNVYVYMVLRALTNLTSGGAFVVSFVLFMEMTGPSKRVFVGIMIEMAWGVGLFVLGFIAYFVRSWQTLQLIISVPTVVFFAFYWIIPESPRWLISRGRIPEAQKIIKKIASTNHVEISPEMYEKITTDEEEKARVTQMFSDCSLLTMTLIIYFNWFVVSMIYYGLGLNVQNLSGDIYLNFTIANIIEMASYIACIVLLDRVGRKILHCGCMVVGGLACLGTIFPVIYAIDWVTVLLSMVGKFGAAGAFAVVYVYTVELFPTVLRNSGLGGSSFCSRIGGLISPYIADLGIIVGGDLKVALPLIVFGASSVAAGILALCLPETRGRKLPETIEDAKNIRKSGGKKNRYTMDNGYQQETDNDIKASSIKTISDSPL